jgi:hypothetical protein
MTGTLTRKLELAANVAIIVVAAVLCAVLVKTYLLAPTPQAPQQQSLVGARVPVPEVDWRGNGRTLLLVLQKGCRFCAESAPFYQRLAREAGQARLVAVLPQQVDESREYLRELSVPVGEVRQAPFKDLGVRGTPTLLLVNGEGVVTGSWFGKLSPDKEEEVLSRLKS